MSMSEIQLCPTCGRRPSEKHASSAVIVSGPNVDNCPDLIHDLADRAPEMAKELERLEVTRAQARRCYLQALEDVKKAVHRRRLPGQIGPIHNRALDEVEASIRALAEKEESDG